MICHSSISDILFVVIRTVSYDCSPRNRSFERVGCGSREGEWCEGYVEGDIVSIVGGLAGWVEQDGKILWEESRALEGQTAARDQDSWALEGQRKITRKLWVCVEAGGQNEGYVGTCGRDGWAKWAVDEALWDDSVREWSDAGGEEVLSRRDWKVEKTDIIVHWITRIRPGSVVVGKSLWLSIEAVTGAKDSVWITSKG